SGRPEPSSEGPSLPRSLYPPGGCSGASAHRPTTAWVVRRGTVEDLSDEARQVMPRRDTGNPPPAPREQKKTCLGNPRQVSWLISPAASYSPTRIPLAVPSALRSLTSEFGMGSGGASSTKPPENFLASWNLVSSCLAVSGPTVQIASAQTPTRSGSHSW